MCQIRNNKSMSDEIMSHKNAKFYHCCVEGCTTYDTSNNFLHFPMDTKWRQQWLAVLPNENLVIDHNTVLCLKHFNTNDIALYTRLKDETGQVSTVRNSTPLVKEGALPSIFPQFEEPEVNYSSVYWPSVMFEIPSRDTSPQTFGDLENVPDGNDYLIDFSYFKNVYKEKLKDIVGLWRTVLGPSYIMFYTMDCRSVPRILTSVKINSKLVVSLTLDGREMDLADLTWIVPITGRLNRWSQVRVLLRHFEKCSNNEAVTAMSI